MAIFCRAAIAVLTCYGEGSCRDLRAIPITDQGASLEWGDAYFQPRTAEELLAGCQVKEGVRLLGLYDDQANYGEFAKLEVLLVREGISFRRRSDSKIEFDAELVENRPGIGRVVYPSDSSGQPFMSLAKMNSVAAAVDNAVETAEGQTALELLRRLRNIQQLIHETMPIVVPPLEPFEIVR